MNAEESGSPPTALGRALAGFGCATALISVLGLGWPAAMAEMYPLTVLGALGWLHQEADRRSTAAIVTAGVLAFAVLVLASRLPGPGSSDLPRGLAYQAVAAVVASQVYAAVVRWPWGGRTA